VKSEETCISEAIQGLLACGKFVYGGVLLNTTIKAEDNSVEGEEDQKYLGYVSYSGITLPTHFFIGEDKKHISDMKLKHIMWILCHESLHMILGHLKVPRDLNNKVANIAMDAVIDRILSREDIFINKDSSIHNDFPNLVKHLHNEIVVGKESFKIPDLGQLDWFDIYLILMKNFKERFKCEGKELEDRINKLLKDYHGGVKPGNDSHEERLKQTEIEGLIARIVFNSKHDKSIGNLPAWLTETVDNLLQPKIDWRTHLRRLVCTEITRNDFSYPNRRKVGLGLFLPQLRNESLSYAILCIDSSGSMSNEDLTKGLSEFAAIRQTQQFSAYFFSCDTEVKEALYYPSEEDIPWTKLPIDGRGGTDFRPVFEKCHEIIRKEGKSPSVIVFFTDGYGPWPDFSDIPRNTKVIVVGSDDCSTDFPDYLNVVRIND
jgi:predicted metal-dependent peptidase